MVNVWSSLMPTVTVEPLKNLAASWAADPRVLAEVRGKPSANASSRETAEVLGKPRSNASSRVAADALPRMYPMMITAAGTITPAKVFIVGAGVAGLQAIASSRRLGAVVQAYDVRPVVKEQVESLGAKFVELELDSDESEAESGYALVMDEEFYRRQRELMMQVVTDSDVVITTAAIPGAKSPILVTEQMVKGMRPGSVIVDLAAEGGGNCELTRPGENIVVDGVTILGPINLPSTIPYHASQMYAKNISTFLGSLVKEGELNIDLEDQVIRDTLLTHEGEVFNSRVRERLGLTNSATPTEERK